MVRPPSCGLPTAAPRHIRVSIALPTRAHHSPSHSLSHTATSLYPTSRCRLTCAAHSLSTAHAPSCYDLLATTPRHICVRVSIILPTRAHHSPFSHCNLATQPRCLPVLLTPSLPQGRSKHTDEGHSKSLEAKIKTGRMWLLVAHGHFHFSKCANGHDGVVMHDGRYRALFSAGVPSYTLSMLMGFRSPSI